jgi:hypothetical protein
LIDIFLGSNTDLKISACIKLSQFTNESSVKLLKLALQDQEYEVRYMANNALGSIEKKLIDKVDLLTENINKFPNISGNYKERAFTYISIYQLNILEETIGELFLRRALDDLMYLLKSSPEAHHTYLTIIQVFTYLNMNDEVIDLADEALKQPDLNEEHLSKLLFFKAEALYNKKDFNNVVRIIKDINPKYLSYEKVQDSLAFWKEVSLAE